MCATRRLARPRGDATKNPGPSQLSSCSLITPGPRNLMSRNAVYYESYRSRFGRSTRRRDARTNLAERTTVIRGLHVHVSTRAIRGLCWQLAALPLKQLPSHLLRNFHCSKIDLSVVAMCQASSTTSAGTPFKASRLNDFRPGSPIKWHVVALHNEISRPDTV